jgi:hypothetical protein
MNDRKGIIAEIDAEIARLQQARVALAGVSGNGRRGRRRRKLSAEARRKISLAQKRRWAKQKAKSR